MPEYYKAYEFDREKTTLDCACGWHGAGLEASVELFDALYELECPRCGKRLAVVALATHDETREAAAAGNENARRDLSDVESVERRWAKAKLLALHDIEVLPDLEGRDVKITWDQEEVDGEQYTVLLHRDRVLWRELAFWEGLTRFKEVVALLDMKYGTRLRGVIPTQRSEMYLGGDTLYAFDAIDSINARLASAGEPQEEPPPSMERLIDVLTGTFDGFQPFATEDGEGAFVRWLGRVLEVYLGGGKVQVMTQVCGRLQGSRDELNNLIARDLPEGAATWYESNEGWLEVPLAEPLSADALSRAFDGVTIVADHIDQALEQSELVPDPPLRFAERVRAGPVAARFASDDRANQ